MKIELRNITVGDLVDGYEDNDELGVRTYCGKLDVRPPFQREFVYKDKQREQVINTLRKSFPRMLLIATDGIHSSFTVQLGASRPPQRLADQILAEHGKGTDDALVFVARYLGRTPTRT